MNRLKKIVFLFFISLSCFSQSYKAEEFQSGLMQTKTGAMVVYTGQKHSFTIDIFGKNIVPSENPNFVTVDNKILQSAILPFQAELDFAKLSEESQKKTLTGFMDYEMNYLREQLKTKKLKETFEFITLNNKLFLFWSFNMPKSNESINQQCYLVTICFDQMLILNSPVVSGKSFDDTKTFLGDIGKTLNLNDHTIDLEKLYHELNK